MVACWAELIDEAVGNPGSFICPYILGSDGESTFSCHFALHPPRAYQPQRAQLLITHYYVVESLRPRRWRPAFNERSLLASFAPSRSGGVADIAVCGTFQAVLSHKQDCVYNSSCAFCSLVMNFALRYGGIRTREVATAGL